MYINGVSTDFLSRTIGDIKIMENGRAVLHDPTHQNAAACDRYEYSSGQYRLRFKLEQCNRNGDFSCGIL
ncbi:unnamed protein product [Rotaria sp. Silwood2]|nr:unnamed protein product [Rotaria sp. Silwood2]CAF3239635.1 unnamed protein product [Rotaria sp. Silwood2]CAF4162550.1 unnamed protein product [Rotaria sp. Silwood2]CAF4449622.1 unnamed protein product [Rotaria sp. Silwood2]